MLDIKKNEHVSTDRRRANVFVLVNIQQHLPAGLMQLVCL